MVGFGTHHFVKSSAKSDWVLVLQPSDDPRDGLVYSKRRSLISDYLTPICRNPRSDMSTELE